MVLSPNCATLSLTSTSVTLFTKFFFFIIYFFIKYSCLRNSTCKLFVCFVVMWAKLKLFLLFLQNIKAQYIQIVFVFLFFFQSNSNAWNSYLLLHTDFLFHLFEINGCAATMWLSCLVYTSFTGRRVLVQQGGGQLGLLWDVQINISWCLWANMEQASQELFWF